MSLVFKDELFDAQWLRAAGHSAYRGAEINECFVAARSIRELDGESWYRSWNALALRIRAEGDASLAHNSGISALGSYGMRVLHPRDDASGRCGHQSPIAK
jgi:hypothetical protein